MSNDRIQQARCAPCRVSFFCLDTDEIGCCSCGGEYKRVTADVNAHRFDWPALWERACVAMSARRDGAPSSVGMPAEAVVYLMRRACVPINQEK